MQFKQLFIAICALTLIFSACKKDETPVLPEMTGLWKAVTFVEECNDPGLNTQEDATQYYCVPGADYCSELILDFKDDGTLIMETVSIAFGEDTSSTSTGTYTVLSETEIELCTNGNNGCIIAVLNEGQLKFMSTETFDDCQLGFILEKR